MKKIGFLLLVIAVLAAFTALTAFSAFNGGPDKAASKASKAELLAARKAALGSTPPPAENVRVLSMTRGRNGGGAASPTAETSEADEAGDEDADSCVSDGQIKVTNTFTSGGDDDWYCLAAVCPGAIVRIDVDSHKLGAPTDTYVEVHEDCTGTPVAARDDGNGFSGVTTDSCVMVTAPASNQIWFRIINLADICQDPNGGDCTYQATVTVTSVLETETNDACPGEDLLVTAGAADEVSDEDADGAVCARDADDAIMSGVIDPAGDVDSFNVCLLAGEVLTVGVEAGKCNNQLDGDLFDPELTLSYFDPAAGSCVPVAAADDIDDLDPGLHYTATNSGEYVIAITNESGSGSPDDLYTISVDIGPGAADASNDCAGAECLDLAAEQCPCDGFKNHGGYVVCVVRHAKELRESGAITQDQFSDMVSEAAQSDCSKPAAPSGKGDPSSWDPDADSKDHGNPNPGRKNR